MFITYHSNQLDLLKTLTSTLIEKEPLKNPFQKEIILVQSPGMAQWLQIQLAQSLGISANIQFPLPATFIWDMFTKVLKNIPKESPFNKDAMTWKLMCLLPDLLQYPIFASIKHYLQDDEDKQKIHQLAIRIADLFDQYLVYRSEWLDGWENGKKFDDLDKNQDWQAALWVSLIRYSRQLEQPEWHRARLYQRFIQALNKNDVDSDLLPKRVFIFGISTLPPIYLKGLEALSRHIDIHFMFNNPCRYFWGDIQNYDILAKLNIKNTSSDLRNIEEEQINPLLASWGRLGRDHLYLLSQIEGLQEIHAFVDIEPDNLLHALQHDMLEFKNQATRHFSESNSHHNKKRLLDINDRSIGVHSCHSQQREVEILQDQLLNLFSEDPALTPRDVIVMVADIDNYAPYIQAVFSNASLERYLPFAISDRKMTQVHPVLQTFIKLLDLPQSRFSSEQVLGLLEISALSQKFEIQEKELSLLREWVEGSGIRWGLDNENVQDLSLPITGQHTWQFGLKRMFLGYAMDSQAGDWEGILPYDESTGLAAELIGKLAQLLMMLSIWRKKLKTSRLLSEWLPLCRDLFYAFFESNAETESIFILIDQQWQNIIQYGLSAQYANTVPVSLIRHDLVTRFENQRISQRFLAGPINFCTLMPMRSIPFKVVCLLGMNEGIYPRILPPLGFDLMAKKRQKGDRSRRDDDRYLFLEALLSAQQYLYISYIGRSIQDNSQRYPSVLVSELLEYIGNSYVLPGDENRNSDESMAKVIQHLLFCHTRMPFSAKNFIKGTEQQSYAIEWLEAAKKHTQEQKQPQDDFIKPLVSEPFSEITLDELINFYRHPIKAFFQLRLGVQFRVEQKELSNEEPFILDPLARYQFNTELLNALIEQKNVDQLYARMQASGCLPFGHFGEIYWQQQKNEMGLIAKKIQTETGHTEFCRLEVNTTLGERTLSGWIAHAQTDGLIRWRPRTLTIVDGLLLWIEHLAYCLSGGKGESRIYGKKESVWRFSALSQSEAGQHLSLFIEGYQKGMIQPLLLLNHSGWAWLTKCYDLKNRHILWDEKTQAKAKDHLLTVFQGNPKTGVRGEGDDPYIQRLFRSINDTHVDRILQEAKNYLLPIAHHNIIKNGVFNEKNSIT